MPGSNGYSRLVDNDEKNKQQQENLQQGSEQKDNLRQVDTTGGGGTATAAADNGGSKAYGYDDIIAQISQEKADLEKKRRRDERIEAAVAAVNSIGDIGSALGNIYAANHYVPTTYDPRNTLSAKSAERAAKAKAEYDKRHDAMMSNLQKFQKANAEFKFSQQKQEMAQQRYAEQMQLKTKELELKAAKLEQAKSDAEWRHGIEETKVLLRERELAITEAYHNGQLSLAQMKVEMNRLNQVQHQLAEYEESYEYDDLTGKVKKKTRTVKNPGEGGAQPKGSGAGQQTEKKPNPMGSGKKPNPMG